MKKIASLFILSLSIFSFYTPSAFSEQITLTTYYPSPFGAYDRLQLVPRTAVAALGTTCSNIGQIYSNSDANGEIYLCGDNDIVDTNFTGVWKTLSPWIQDNNKIYPSGTITSKKLLLGTTTADLMLTLGTDGGIVASGAFGSGATLTSAGAGTRFIWYPLKAAFRAGQITGTEWNTASIGNHSVAFGLNTTAYGTLSSVLGGDSNTIDDADSAAPNLLTGAVISGGQNNSIQLSTGSTGDLSFSAVGGGDNNNILTGDSGDGVSTTISGGTDNTIESQGANSVNYSAIGGGNNNAITGASASAVQSTIGGGADNDISSSDNSIVAGGNDNNITSSDNAVISGGADNDITSADNSTVAGGNNNTILSGGDYSIIAGGRENETAGQNSFVAGYNMRLDGSADNTFAFGHSGTPVTISASDSFIIYSGNVGIGPGAPRELVHIQAADTPVIYLESTNAALGGMIILKDVGGATCTSLQTRRVGATSTLDVTALASCP